MSPTAAYEGGTTRRTDLATSSCQEMQGGESSGDDGAEIQSAANLVPNPAGLAYSERLDKAIEVETEVIEVLLPQFEAQLRAQVEAIRKVLLALDAELGEVPPPGDDAVR
jgi:hypothetical protein